MALGATQWQTIWRQVLPAAIPGIATGVILALSRAIGETAPLIVVGAATVIAFNPDGLDSRSPRCRSRSSTGSPARPTTSTTTGRSRRPAILLLMILLLADEQRRDLATKPLRAEVVGELRVAESRDRARGQQTAAEPSASTRRPWSGAPAPRAGKAAARARSSSLDDVTVSYGDKPAVRDVTFDIGKNEITALIGPSGCGKSTLIRCLNRMNDLIPTRTGRGQGPLPRAGPLRARGGRGGGAQAHRHGVPEAEPVPQVDLRQHRLRPARARHEGRTWTRSWSGRCARPRSGTR